MDNGVKSVIWVKIALSFKLYKKNTLYFKKLSGNNAKFLDFLSNSRLASMF